jgi:ABC-type Fe3+ transport system permease subunit
VTRISRRRSSRFVAVPLALLLGLMSVPLLFLLTGLRDADLGIEWSSFGPTLGFAVGGAALASITGAAIGMLSSLREFPGRRGLLVLSVVPIAAPPAFWWIGATRLTSAWGNANGPGAAAVVAGLALSPVTLLLVFAAVRQLPSNLYEAARVALPPVARLRSVLLPLLRAPLAGGFVLTVILLLGESELPFLFGFRTVMTDIVTTFSQTFDVDRTVPLVIPLLVVILGLGGLAARPLMRTVMTSSRGAHGVVRTRASAILSLCAAAPAGGLLLAIGGYAWAIIGALPSGWPRVSIDASTTSVSILEPVGCAWSALIVTLVAAYPARRSAAVPVFLWIGLLLFCVPAGIYAIGWLGVGQIAGGLAIPPIVAHTSRAVALSTLGFAVGYARLPRSLEDAAALVDVSAVRRAFVFVLPLIVFSLMAASALVAALTYADRDVASLLLAPGASRLTLNLYLASANAPASTVGALALVVLTGAAVTVIVAAAGPALLWGRRE